VPARSCMGIGPEGLM
jgi:hypothetical protein